MHNYGDRITWILKARGLSWKEISNRTGIGQSTLSNCKKINKFTTDQLEAIASAIGISIAELVDFDNEIGRQKEIVDKLRQVHQELGEQLSELT